MAPAKSARTQVTSLIRHLGEASSRPLFVELALVRSKEKENDSSIAVKVSDTFKTATATISASKDKSGTAVVEKRTWVELLKEASGLLPFCTEEEHGEILRISSIYLLAHLLPYSTGTDFYLLQNMKRDKGSVLANEYILQMPLEERLEQTVIHSLSSNQYGDDEFSLTDPDVDLSLDALLEAIAVLLQKRPANGQQVELLHLLAMMIHPYHAPDSLPKPSPAFCNTPACAQAARLTEHAAAAVALQFQIHSGHRRQVVQLVREHLVVPELRDEYAGVVVGAAPLFGGALPHLLASLRSFAAAAVAQARAQRDAHAAVSAMVAVAVQCRNDRLFLKPAWDFLLHHMVDDLDDYQCRGKCHCQKRKSKRVQQHAVESSPSDGSNEVHDSPPVGENAARDRFFCPHSARGELLSEFIVRSCRSRRDADPLFLAHITISLTEAIEWQIDCWTQHPNVVPEEDKDETKKSHSPCLLASLLHAAIQIFYLQIPEEKDDDDDDDPYDTLVRCSIQLLRHSDRGIVYASARLLVVAFSNAKCNKVDRFVALLFATISICIKQNKTGSLLESLIAVSSSQSPSFALSLYKLILAGITDEKLEDAVDMQVDDEGKQRVDDSKDLLFRLLASVSLNCPVVASKGSETLAELVGDTTLSQDNRLRAASSLLSSRLARFFVEKDDTAMGVAGAFALSASTNNWKRYQMAQHALLTGNGRVAAELLGALLTCPMSEKHYMWISVLEKVASADSSLSKHGAMGIPEATTALQSAVSYLHSLGSFSAAWRVGGTFQLRFLLLRLDFLDLTAVLRQLTREMRLTGNGPAKHTRSFLHLRNVVRGFTALSSRYRELGQQYGMCFQYSQSRSSLAMLRSLSSFMALSTKSAFSDLLVPRTGSSKTQAASTYCSVDIRHPMASLMRRLDELVVQPMDSSLDPLIRAAALLELIDGILMVPLPFPRDFFAPRPAPSPMLLISADPTRIFDSYDESLETIETIPSMGFAFYATGHIPEAFLQRARVPTWTTLLWFRLEYAGPLVEDDDNNNKDSDYPAVDESEVKEMKIPDLSAVSPASSGISPDGNFSFKVECPPLLDEGLYKLKAKLGCRDAAGNEWEIPCCSSSSQFSTTVRVSRSRSLV